MAYSALSDNDAPCRDDGSPWPHVVVVGGQAYGADTMHELVGCLPEFRDLGYNDLPHTPEGDEQAALMRIDTGERLLALFQRARSLEAIASGNLDLEDFDDNEVNLLMGGDRGPGVPGVTRWDEDATLLLMAHDYAPYTDVAPPTGENIIFIDTSDDANFLQSLADIGAIALTHSAEPGTEDEARREA